MTTRAPVAFLFDVDNTLLDNDVIEREFRAYMIREAGDALELLIPHGDWPLPTYREMLFIK